MAHLGFGKEITAVAEANDCIPHMLQSVHRQPDRPDQDRERPLSLLTPGSSTIWKWGGGIMPTPSAAITQIEGGADS